MSKYYGTLQGTRGQATRCGTASSGMESNTASWSGAVNTWLYLDDNERVCARISFRVWHGHGVSRVIYDGPIDPNVTEHKRHLVKPTKSS